MTWVAPEIDIKVKRVCKSCNNGWMSRLENDVQPILRPMMTASGGTISLSPNDQEVLARWIYKTVLMADFALTPDKYRIPHPTPIPKSDYSTFYAHRTPPNSAVIWTAGYTGERKIHGTQREQHTLLEKTNQRIRLYLITFSVLRAVFQVLGALSGILDDLPIRGDPDRGVVRIWPPRNRPIDWP